ncbi:hypothetical protein WMF45_41525 [Sorangium sp. So ce448]|uniref:hypothetical protein n=1 Tax=Sorangium sp. So ce448 TaxID=3133314 RepID=UPI003F63F202
MARRQPINTKNMPRSGNVIHVSAREMWELAWLRKLGLEDIEWDAARYCEHCRAERAAQEEELEEIAPPSGMRFNLLISDDGEDNAPSANAPRTRSESNGKPISLTLVRPRRPDYTEN